MSTTYRIASVVLLSLFVAACSSAPDVVDQELVDQESAEDLLQTPDVLMAFRVAPGELSEMTPVLQRLAQSTDEPQLRELADISPDPIGHLARSHDMPNELSSLAQDQAAYVLLSHQGNQEFLRAALLGLPTDTEEWPAFVNLRLLLPTASPDDLRDEITPWMDRLIEADTVQAYQLFDGPGFVRVELAVEFIGAGGTDADVDADQWLDDLHPDQLQPPVVADYRPTPAYDAFVDSDSPLGLWSPIESFSVLGTIELLDTFASEYRQVGAAGQPRFFLEGVARMAAASVADDPIAAENEDVSLLLLPGDDGSVLIDLHSTRTEQGAHIYRAMDRTVTLPAFEDAASFLQLAFHADVDALEMTAELPYWTIFDDPDDTTGLEAQFDGVDESVLPFTDDQAGLTLLTAALQYPWTGFLLGSDFLDGFIPLPRALAIEGRTLGHDRQFPIGAVVAGAFPDEPETRDAIQQLFMAAESYVPGALDAELLEREDDLLEVRLVFGLSLHEAFGDSPPAATLEEPLLSIDMRALDQLAGMVDGPDAVDLFDDIHVRAANEATHQTLRVSVGTPEAVPPETIEARVEPRPSPRVRCRTEIAAAAIEYLSDLRTDPQGHVDTWAQTVEQRASACLDPTHPALSLIEERLDLARQIATEIP